MDSSSKKRLEERIVKKVSSSILYKINAFERMCNKFHDTRIKAKSNCIQRPEEEIHTNYAFENFFYYCLEKWEKGELE